MMITKEKENKYDYLLILQGNYGYGYGWVDLCAAEDNTKDGIKSIRADLREYQENEGGTYRIIRRRELRESFS